MSTGSQVTGATNTDGTTLASDGTGDSSSDSGEETDLGGFVDLGVGMGPSPYHSCLIRADQTVECWGAEQPRATAPEGLLAVKIASGHSHNCAITPRGGEERVVCWGHSDGVGPIPELVDPVDVRVGHRVSCVIEGDHSVVCWGDDRADPNPPAELQAKFLALSGQVSCAIDLEDTVVCWGGSPPQTPTPAPDAIHIAVGQNESDTEGVRHVCIVRPDHTVSCWGDEFGASGEHVPPPAGLLAREVAVGRQRACAIDMEGLVVCWGMDNYGAEPISKPPEVRARAIRLVNYNACALALDSDTTICWGRNDRGHTAGPNGLDVLVP